MVAHTRRDRSINIAPVSILIQLRKKIDEGSRVECDTNFMRGELSTAGIKSFEDLVHRLLRASVSVCLYNCRLDETIVQRPTLLRAQSLIRQPLIRIGDVLQGINAVSKNTIEKSLKCEKALLPIENKISSVHLLNKHDSRDGKPEKKGLNETVHLWLCPYKSALE